MSVHPIDAGQRLVRGLYRTGPDDFWAVLADRLQTDLADIWRRTDGGHIDIDAPTASFLAALRSEFCALIEASIGTEHQWGWIERPGDDSHRRLQLIPSDAPEADMGDIKAYRAVDVWVRLEEDEWRIAGVGIVRASDLPESLR